MTEVAGGAFSLGSEYSSADAVNLRPMETRRRWEPFRSRRGAVAGTLIAVISAGVYMAWLGWDQEYQVDPATGALSGPYETWQVVGVVACLGLVAFVAGLLGLRTVCRVALPAAFALCFSIDGITDPNSDGLWGVGAAMTFGGAWVGANLVGIAAERLRRPAARA